MNQATKVTTSELLKAVRTPIEKLYLIENLLETFHSYNISYCHWKSNEHLNASMTGDTDLDILFDIDQKEKLHAILTTLGFKLFKSVRQKQYRDIEDYLGLDIVSGKVVHLHTHFRLTMGEPYLKSYQLDLEQQLLKTRIFDKDFGIYCTHPAYELILLYFREALKMRNRDIIGLYLFKKNNYSDHLMREYVWLKHRSTRTQIDFFLKNIFTNYQDIYQNITGIFEKRSVLKLSFLLKKKFTDLRNYSPVSAIFTRWYREISIKLFRKSQWFSDRPVVSKRINPRGGLVVAVIGADGSGKSTVIANLKSTFSQKLDVYSLYMGRGDGKVSPARKILLYIKRKLKATTKKHKHDSGLLQPKHEAGFTYSLFKSIEALLIANEKRHNLLRMATARKKGMLVICDRFPQNQQMGYNDGPLLHHLADSPNLLFRFFSKVESRIYAKSEANPPDLVFKLVAEPHIVLSRKPYEHSFNLLREKINGIKRLNFNDTCKVIDVDAGQPLPVVLSIIKKNIWLTYS